MQAMALERRRCGIGKMLFQQDDGGAARLCDVIRAYVAACERRRRKSGGTLANASALSLSLGRPYHSRPRAIVPNYFGRSNNSLLRRVTKASGSSRCVLSARVAL